MEAAAVLQSVRSFPEVDRVDTDEIYPTLSLTERQLGHWQESLSVVAEGWARMDLREAALDRGVIVWHMHALNGEIEKISLRRGRLLAAQATALATVDLVESAKAMVSAMSLAPNDGVISRLAEVRSRLRFDVA